MPGHLDAVFNATVGSDVAGIKVDSELIESQFPGRDESGIVFCLRDNLRLLFYLRQVSGTTMTVQEAIAHVDQFVTEID